MASLVSQERPAAGEARGLLVLHHGRGTDERDLLPLAGALDPERRLHVVSVRAPHQLPGAPGYHWYQVLRVGFPHRETFAHSYRELAAFHDELWARTGIGPERTVLGGFSMGAVMSYSMGLGGDRPAPAGILAFSGFIPTVEGWEPSFSDREQLRVLIGHGRYDEVISVEFARRARELLEQAGIEPDYRESDTTHAIDPSDVPRAASWLAAAID
jgi:phospholipase/carboxylesterase